MIRRPEVRLLTLTGTSSVGKTRLGLQVATRLTNDFANQVCVFSLSEMNDPDLIVPLLCKYDHEMKAKDDMYLR